MPRVSRSAADSRDILSRAGDGPDLTLRWADTSTHGADGVVDVYLPGSPDDTGAPAQAPVVLLHGGFWRDEYDRRYVRPLAVAMRGTGRTVLVPEYRRTGGWPAVAADVGAVRALLPRLLAETLPATTLPAVAVPDPVAPVVVGHSAGGQLAIWWALGAAADALPPTRVVALAPVADLARAHAERLDDDAVRDLLGGEPDDHPEAYADADVAARLRAGEPTPPVLVLHGSADDLVPVEHSRALAADVDAVTLVELVGTGHFEPVDPLSAAWPEVLAALG